jgi:glycosyltransferase involved in cell wall biosynthesis
VGEVRVLYVHQHFSTPSGAVGTRSYEMARRLVARGHSVLMVCGSFARQCTGLTAPYMNGVRRGTVDGIEVIEYELRYSNHDEFVERAMKFVRFSLWAIGVAARERYDMLFATSTPLTAGLPGIFARWIRHKPFVFEVRDLWPALPRAMGVITNPLALGAMSLLEWVSYKSAHRLIGLAPGIVDGIASRGVDRGRIEMIPNGCDLDLFSPVTTAVRPAGAAPSDLVALFAGAHGIANGLDAVLDAAIELKRRGRGDIKIVLIGEGKLKPRLVERARTVGLTNVIFLDSVKKTELAGLLAGCDLGLQILDNVPAFYRGTSPNKFFDYIAIGLPVLINYPGWLADIVRERDIGYPVQPSDADAFADALIHAADHRAALPAMGERARMVAQIDFPRDLLADRFVRWLEGAAE